VAGQIESAVLNRISVPLDVVAQPNPVESPSVSVKCSKRFGMGNSWGWSENGCLYYDGI
jgi:hypothetical protein